MLKILHLVPNVYKSSYSLAPSKFMIDRFSDMQIIEWTGNMSASTLQVAIHDHSEEPNIMDSGYLVSPGYTTYMPIEVKEVICKF